MYLDIVKDNGKITRHPIRKEYFCDTLLDGQVGYIGTQSKESNALKIFKAYFSEAKAILLDETNKAILEQLISLNVPEFMVGKNKKTIFEREDFSFMYYTSGSTGFPVAALKTKTNIELEVESLGKVLQQYTIKRVLVTVPFIHLYGTLLGLMYPLLNDIDIVLKEHFLPHDLLDMIEPHTMVVTTPLYIKALNKLSEEKDLRESVFISSTAPLDVDNIQQFKCKYHTDIIQIFGSTETGGIAYKVNQDEIWKPFEYVEISINAKQELKVKSPFVSRILYENGFKKTKGEIDTFDYAEDDKEGFKLLGRSSKIFKLAGKRYSTIQIENILESIDEISKALVFVALEKASLRGEYLDITLETNRIFSIQEIKKILQNHLSNLKFSITLNIVKEIPVNQVGKKLRIK